MVGKLVVKRFEDFFVISHPFFITIFQKVDFPCSLACNL